jgi:hypothetical protein
VILLFWKTPVGGDVDVTITSTLPAVQSDLQIDDGVALQLDKGSWPQVQGLDIRIASILPVPRSRLVIDIAEEEFALMLLLGVLEEVP